MEKSNVVITDIQMPFGSMVTFMVKWAIATIPALLILIGVSMLVVALGSILING